MVQATKDQIMATLRQDVDQMEKSKIWPFSCYAVVKEMKGGVSGFFDVSQEELRLNYYLNRSNTQVHIENVQALSQKVTEARQRVANPQNKNQIYRYQEYQNGGNPSPSSGVDLSWLNVPGQKIQNTGSSFGNQQSNGLFGSSTNSAFGSGASSAFGNSAFGSSATKSAFGSSAQTSSPFGSSTTSQSAFGSSAFGSTNQGSAFGSNPFGSSSSSNQQQNSGFGSSAFGSASSGFGQSAFGSGANQPNNSMTQASNPFGTSKQETSQTTETNANPFQSKVTNSSQEESTSSVPVNPFQVQSNSGTSVFGAASHQIDQKDKANQQDDSVVYSPLEKLSPAEIEAFKAEKFTIENLPIHPPPKEACFA